MLRPESMRLHSANHQQYDSQKKTNALTIPEPAKNQDTKEHLIVKLNSIELL